MAPARVCRYLANMFKAFEFCIPTKSTSVPDGPDWLHEVKYDGYRIRLERDGDRVRLITRGGYDWTKRYPWIVEAALKKPLQAIRARWRGRHPWRRRHLRFQRSGTHTIDRR
jgi:ATP-dependent DNA ligase